MVKIDERNLKNRKKTAKNANKKVEIKINNYIDKKQERIYNYLILIKDEQRK